MAVIVRLPVITQEDLSQAERTRIKSGADAFIRVVVGGGWKVQNFGNMTKTEND